MSHSWRDSGVSAISKSKHVLLQQILGFSVSHASCLKMRKDMVKIRMKMTIRIVILYDFFMCIFGCKFCYSEELATKNLTYFAYLSKILHYISFRSE
jgi:hypothetical protein